ncbi:MAG TPA: hypothetical protein VK525_04000 [Candidatus Saccharimonadales bacterium]|nr:hypothetical protein [Candidatus Saccharimonadales bacterium]
MAQNSVLFIWHLHVPGGVRYGGPPDRGVGDSVLAPSIRSPGEAATVVVPVRGIAQGGIPATSDGTGGRRRRIQPLPCRTEPCCAHPLPELAVTGNLSFSTVIDSRLSFLQPVLPF